MKNLQHIIILVFANFSTQAIAQGSSVFPKGEKAPNVHHTGDVWPHYVSDADDTFTSNNAEREIIKLSKEKRQWTSDKM